MTLISPLPQSRLLNDESPMTDLDESIEQVDVAGISIVRGSYCDEIKYGPVTHFITPPLREVVRGQTYTLSGLEKVVVGKGSTIDEAQKDFAKRFHRIVGLLHPAEKASAFSGLMSRLSGGLSSFLNKYWDRNKTGVLELIEVDDIVFEFSCASPRVLATYYGHVNEISETSASVTLYDESGEESEADIDASKIRSGQIDRGDDFKMTIKAKRKKLWLKFEKLPEQQLTKEFWDRIERQFSWLLEKQRLSPEQLKDLLS